MVLAAYGTFVEESTLEAAAHLEESGTAIDELERLARQFGLTAAIQVATLDELRDILAQGKLPIVYLDRAVFELSPRERLSHSLRQAKIHSVIPTGFTEAYVTLHDPLAVRRTRRSIALFKRAHEMLGSSCVVCAKR
jgi:hypothetical protein